MGGIRHRSVGVFRRRVEGDQEESDEGRLRRGWGASWLPRWVRGGMLRQGILENKVPNFVIVHGTRDFCLTVIFTLTRWCGATQTRTRANTCVVFVVGRDLPGGDIIGVLVPLNTKLLGPANHNVAPPTPADDAATTSNPLCIFRVLKWESGSWGRGIASLDLYWI